MHVKSSFQIYLHSKDKDRSYNGDLNSKLRFYLDNPIHIDTTKFTLEMSLISFMCPIVWGNVNENNNTLTVNGNTIVLPVGNYNIDDVCNALNTHYNNLTFTFNEITNKITLEVSSNEYVVGNEETFSINGVLYNIPAGTYANWSDLLTAVQSVLPANFTLSFNILGTIYNNLYLYTGDPFTFQTNSPVFNYLGFTNFTNNEVHNSVPTAFGSNNFPAIESNLEKFNIPNYISGTLFDALGFTNTQSIVYRSFSPSALSNFLTSEHNFDFSGYPYIVLASNFNTQNISSYKKRRTKILAHIPIENPHYISFHNTGFKFLLNESDIHYIDIELLNPDHLPIDMKQSEFSLTLQLDFLPV